MRVYDICLDGSVVGNVQVTTEGLYTRFACQCSLTDKQIHRLLLVSDGREVDLGIFVPQGECYAINKKIPSKQILSDEISFQIISTRDQSKELIPIMCNKPFPCVSQLEKLRLCVKNGIYGAYLTDQPKSR